MSKRLHRRLITLAKRGETVSYGLIAPIVRLDMRIPADRGKLGAILGEISEEERRRGHPLLTAIVVRTVTKRPGIGFFNMARAVRAHRTADDVGFFRRELLKVHRWWARK